jgi:RecJ-like exonuclease
LDTVEGSVAMTELTISCTKCNGKGRDGYDCVCPPCGGTGHTLTTAGEQVKKFILTLLGDPQISAEVSRFVRGVESEIDAAIEEEKRRDK